MPSRILLVDPPNPVSYSNFLIPHMGLAYLASVLNQAGHQVQTFLGQMEKNPQPSLCKVLETFHPHFVCFSAPTYKIRQASILAETVKQWDPGIRTVLGGWHVTALPKRTLEEFPLFDFGIFGEGENTLPLLVDSSMQEKETYHDIRGLVWRKGMDVVQNPPSEFLQDLDGLPRPAWHLFSLHLSVPMYRSAKNRLPDYPLMTARGCPYHCLFCKSVTGHKVRTRSVEDVVDEYGRGLGVYRCEAVQFFDESFTVLPDRARAICERLLQTGMHKTSFWNCASRVDGLSRELVFLMKRSGCRVIQFGLESGNQDVLDKNRKLIRLEQSMNAVNWCREAGVLSDVSFIFGLPYDTKKSIRDTVKFSFDLDPDFVSYFTLVPFPETEAYRLAVTGGANLRLLSDDWDKFSKQFFPLVTPVDVAPTWLMFLRLLSYSRFYFRKRKIKNLLAMFNIRSLPRILVYSVRQWLPSKNT